ncbi:MAG: type 4a pilus biogenesis protein PilO [Syntrophaceae bacterium]|nr:type 4a pilus biogenesis protein PilO [Syntrophaceae bacterium]
MLEQKINMKIPRRSIVFLSLAIIGIFAIIFTVIIPNQVSLTNLDKTIENLKFQVEEQQIFSDLHKQLTKTNKKEVRTLPMPSKSNLPREQHDQIISMIRHTALKARLETVAITPDLSSVAGSAASISINTTLRGIFFDFRRFLMELGDVQYLEHIDEIHIQQGHEKMDFKMKIRFAVD